jgi:hypothetical protein
MTMAPCARSNLACQRCRRCVPPREHFSQDRPRRMSLSRRQDRRSLIRSVRGRLELTRRLAQGRTFAVHGVDDARLAVGGDNGMQVTTMSWTVRPRASCASSASAVSNRMSAMKCLSSLMHRFDIDPLPRRLWPAPGVNRLATAECWLAHDHAPQAARFFLFVEIVEGKRQLRLRKASKQIHWHVMCPRPTTSTEAGLPRPPGTARREKAIVQQSTATTTPARHR